MPSYNDDRDPEVEVVDNRTGEVLSGLPAVRNDVAPADPFYGIGTLAITHEEATQLLQEFPAERIDILPTGECLAPETRVLTADLRWVPIGDVRLGDEMLSVDENCPARQQKRKMQVGVVEATRAYTGRPALRVDFTDGTRVVCSPDHRWLASTIGQNAREWREARFLRPGYEVAALGRPWPEDASRAGGYLAGVYDGEGCIPIPTAARPQGDVGPRGAYRIIVSQNPGAVLDHTVRALLAAGFSPSAPRTSRPCWNIELSGLYECLRFLGQVRPLRLLEKSRLLWERKAFMSNSATVEAVHHLTGQTLVDIQTSTGTFLAEGLVTHNCYLTQVEYRRLLNAVFGPGAWGLRRMTAPEEIGGTVMVVYALVVRGCVVSEAPGEADYQPNNPRQSKATAMESAKSNALMRVCKDLGIASQCWDRRWGEKFKDEHCLMVKTKNSQKPLWRRQDSKPFWDEIGPWGAQGSPRSDERPPPAQTGGQRRQTAPAGSGDASGGDARAKAMADVIQLAGQYARTVKISPDEAVAEFSGYDDKDGKRREVTKVEALRNGQMVSLKWLQAMKRRGTEMLAEAGKAQTPDGRDELAEIFPDEPGQEG